MIEWHLERLGQSAVLLAAASVAVLLGMAAIAASTSTFERAFGALFVAVVIAAAANIIGSSLLMGAACLLFGVVAVATDMGAVALGGVGIGLFLAMTLHDHAVSFRRGASIEVAVWRQMLLVFMAVSALGAGLGALSWLIATRTIWQALVVPIAVIAVGFGVRFTVDGHVRRTGTSGGSI